jgi:hypothetical protein
MFIVFSSLFMFVHLYDSKSFLILLTSVSRDEARLYTAAPARFVALLWLVCTFCPHRTISLGKKTELYLKQWKSLYMHICAYAYTFIYTSMRTHITYTYGYTYIPPGICIYIHIYGYMCLCSHACIHMRKHIHVHRCIRTHTYTPYLSSSERKSSLSNVFIRVSCKARERLKTHWNTNKTQGLEYPCHCPFPLSVYIILKHNTICLKNLGIFWKIRKKLRCTIFPKIIDSIREREILSLVVLFHFTCASQQTIPITSVL